MGTVVVEMVLIARKKLSWQCWIHRLFKSLIKWSVFPSPRCVEVEYVSSLAHSTYRSKSATAGDQQMIGSRRQIYGHFVYEGLVQLRYREILRKNTTDGCFICCRVKKAPTAQVVNKGSPCFIHSLDGVAMLSHLYTSQVCATTLQPIRAMSAHSNAPTPPLPALHDPHPSAPTHLSTLFKNSSRRLLARKASAINDEHDRPRRRPTTALDT